MVFLSLSSVSSADVVVNGSNTTSQIQSIISGSGTDDIIFEGEFTNLSTIHIDRSIKISGKNATIIRNSSTTGSLTLFNITATNVIIENLIIRGYNQTIVSNSNNLLIQNNQITSANTAINITTSTDLNNVEIKNNVISTSRTNATGIYLSSNPGSLYNNNISNNTITTSSGGAYGIYLSSYNNALYDNVIYGNVIITTQTASAYGIYIRSEDGGVINNNISRNNVTTRNDHGIYIMTQKSIIDNNLISYNNVFITVTSNAVSSTSYVRGIFLSGNNGGANVTNNNISDNNIKIEAYGICPSRAIELYTNNGRIVSNTISANTILMNSSETLSYGMYLYGFSGNISNINIYSNNIVVNSTAIYIATSSNSYSINNVNISYNRILAGGDFITLTKVGTNNTASANWFGNNTPDMSRFINIDILSYYVVNATASKNNSLVGENWTIDYSFYLNNTNDVGEFYKLPFFQSQLFNASQDQISERTAYDTGVWSIVFNHPTTVDFTIVLDNEIISLGEFVSQKGKTTINGTVDGVIATGKNITINAVLKNIQGAVLANKLVSIIFNNTIIETKATDANGRVFFTHTINSNEVFSFILSFAGDEDYEESSDIHQIKVPKNIDPIVDPIINPNVKPIINIDPVTPDDIDNEDPENPDSDELNNNSKETSKTNTVANASMENTGNPMILLAICLLLAIFVPGLMFRKRK